MSKWRVTVELDDPEDYNAGDIQDLVRWALEDSNYTTDRFTKVTVEPATEEAYVRVR